MWSFWLGRCIRILCDNKLIFEKSIPGCISSFFPPMNTAAMHRFLLVICLGNLSLEISFQIMKEIDENKIKIYEFPDVEEEEESKENKKLPMVSIPRVREKYPPPLPPDSQSQIDFKSRIWNVARWEYKTGNVWGSTISCEKCWFFCWFLKEPVVDNLSVSNCAVINIPVTEAGIHVLQVFWGNKSK